MFQLLLFCDKAEWFLILLKKYFIVATKIGILLMTIAE
jgi:hypothetical protein